MTKIVFNGVLQKIDKEFMLSLIPFAVGKIGNICQDILQLYMTRICRKLVFLIFRPLN